ncbi:hypothetical protein F5Y19DRAFT_472098 [Xylariaceae sp. FL1651]|nr:hypothetical protein F5Y19DRAFT_472098 [Xylariaceae sp. FL1651]
MSILWFILVACNILVLVVTASSPKYSSPVLSQQHVNGTTYDFIIAGGGIAGLTVADRLTENPKVSVLVIEDGPLADDSDGVLVPGAWDPIPYLPKSILSEPQKFLGSRNFPVNVGRVVGGGSVVNPMVSIRASKEEYDSWSKLGAASWGWNDLLPFFKKSENFTAPDDYLRLQANVSWLDDVHGVDGPFQVSYPNHFYQGSGDWWSAALHVGLTPSEDPNGGSPAGLFFYTTSEDFTNRTRSHAQLSHYTRVIKNRPNYHLLPGTVVSKILFEGTRAVGVSFLQATRGPVYSVSASKEVLLAAGALGTPKLLMLSGIGPRYTLDKLGINPVVELPGVGSNLQDHLSFSVPYNFTKNLTPNAESLASDTEYAARQKVLYDERREGAYVIVNGFSTNIAFVPFRNATLDPDDILQRLQNPNLTSILGQNLDTTVRAGYQAQRAAIQTLLDQANTPIAMIHWNSDSKILIFMLRPLSRGTVTINSTDPLKEPVVDFGALAEPVDLDLALAGFRKSREIMKAPIMRALGATEATPFGDTINEDDALKQILVDAINPTSAHQCCTAPMMPLDQGGVVDSNMRVYGAQNLRVIDVSYWPFILSGFPMATMYASGEKIAAIIKVDHHI